MEGYDVSIEQLGQLSVYDEEGQKSDLLNLWTTQTAVLVFVRHFG